MYEGLLVRVGIDSTSGGWVAPCNSRTRDYMYVPMGKSEKKDLSTAYDERYAQFKEKADCLTKDFVSLPKKYFFPSKLPIQAHFDPDIKHFTYGDWKQRAHRIETTLGKAMEEGKTSFIAFYSSFRDVTNVEARLEYGIWAIYYIDKIVKVADLDKKYWNWNEHSRGRNPNVNAEVNLDDIVLFADKSKSIILDRYIPIGDWRNKMYRVHEDLLIEWGGLDVKDGYIQRSAFLPKFKEPVKFLQWFENARLKN